MNSSTWPVNITVGSTTGTFTVPTADNTTYAVTTTFAQSGLRVYVNGNQVYVNSNQVSVTSRPPGKDSRKTKKKMRQISPQCSRKAFAPHLKCAGELYGDRRAEDGLWCACHCHPEPVPREGDPPSPAWRLAKLVWVSARKALDLEAQEHADKAFRAAQLSKIRRRREQHG